LQPLADAVIGVPSSDFSFSQQRRCRQTRRLHSTSRPAAAIAPDEADSGTGVSKTVKLISSMRQLGVVDVPLPPEPYILNTMSSSAAPVSVPLKVMTDKPQAEFAETDADPMAVA
jgi:hypothetical protein